MLSSVLRDAGREETMRTRQVDTWQVRVVYDAVVKQRVTKQDLDNDGVRQILIREEEKNKEAQIKKPVVDSLLAFSFSTSK